MTRTDTDAGDGLRADKWLWHARFFKTRSLASKVVSSGHMRVNGARVTKRAHAIKVGDVLTFPQVRKVRVVRVQALSDRRGPAADAQQLYEDLTPEDEKPAGEPVARRGRPNRQQRNAARLCKRGTLE